jgi:hypothetical protein
MKKLIQNFSLIAFSFVFCLGLNAQNLVNTFPSSSTTNCNGKAEIDSLNFAATNATNWYWSDASTILQQGGVKFDNRCPGDYTFNYTDTSSTLQTISFYIGLDTNANGGGTGNDPCANMFVNINVTPVTDSINCDGVLEVMVTGGKAPFTYVWDNNSTITSSVYDNACVGNYHVTVTDADNCMRGIGAYLNIAGDTTNNGGGNGGTNDPCSMYQNVSTTFNIQPASDSTTCNGSVELVVTGLPANTPVSYSWNNGPTTLLNNNLCPGDYTITMSDTNNCSQTLTAHVPVAGDTTNNGGGKGVLAKTFEGHTADLDVNTLAKGQYVLTLKNEQGIKTVTLVK